MAQAQVVYSASSGDANSQGSLFDGKKFWLSARVPQRSWILQLIQSNGGQVVKLEQDADVLIADHVRKDSPPNSFSYEYITESVLKRALKDMEAFRIRPRETPVRSIGSPHASKRTRTAFTAEDDQMLWDWVKKAENVGAALKGNMIYKSLAEAQPHHTYQSWRDRWMKHVCTNPPIGVLQNAPPTPPTDQTPPLEPTSNMPEADMVDPNMNVIVRSSRSLHTSSVPSPVTKFAEGEVGELMDKALYIVQMDENLRRTSWENWAREHPHRSAEEWSDFFNAKIFPEWLSRTERAVDTFVLTSSCPNSARPSAEKSKINFQAQVKKMDYPTNTEKSANAGSASTRSPSFEPESPQIHSSAIFTTPSKPVALSMQVSQQMASPELGKTSSNDLVEGTPSRGRKRKHNPPRSTNTLSIRPSPNQEQRQSHKRSRLSPRASPTKQNEIPDTPQQVDPYVSRILFAKEQPGSPVVSPRDEDQEQCEEQEHGLTGGKPEVSLLQDSGLQEQSDKDEYENEDDTEDGYERIESGTQALLAAEPMPVDFDIPSPEGGWASDIEPEIVDTVERELHSQEDHWDSDAIAEPAPAANLSSDPIIIDSDKESEHEPTSRSLTEESPPLRPVPLPRQRSEVPETQMTLIGPSHAITFDTMEPLTGWTLIEAPSSPKAVRESPSAPEPAPAAERLDAWLTSHTSIPEDFLLSALKATSMDIALAESILTSILSTGCIPNNLSGVWTDRDDEVLNGSDARLIKKLEKKHGSGMLDERIKFLMHYGREE